MSRENRVLSIFDVLGPIMIGPSSNHTAGAVRIGKMARMIFGKIPSSIVFRFYGSLAETYKGHMTDSAVLAGILGMEVDDVNISKSIELAKENGISISILTKTKSRKNPNTIEMSLNLNAEKMDISSVSIGGGEIVIHKINEFKLNFQGNHDLLFILHEKNDALNDKILKILKKKVTSYQQILGNKVDCAYFYLDELPNSREIDLIKKLDGVNLIRVLKSLYFYELRDTSPFFTNVEDVLELYEKTKKYLPEIITEYEARRSGLTKEDIRNYMKIILNVMKEEVRQGLTEENKLIGGIMDGQDAKRMYRLYREKKTITGDIIPLAIARSLASSEVNASMGRVVAAPTAGAVGVIPGVILTLAEKLNSSEEDIIDALLVSAGIGLIIANVAPISGAMGGCQSEVGVASAMAAGAAVQLAGGNIQQVFQAMTLAIKNLLGLVCDTVAGPVEVPCIKRNIIGVANAFAVAEMSMAGIKSMIPPDEVIFALRNVQKLMPMELRDTTLGGLGATKTAKRLKREWFNKIK